MNEYELRSLILEKTKDYCDKFHNNNKFIPGETHVPVSGRTYDAEDMQSLTESALDFWLTTGRFNTEFEKQLGSFLQSRHVLTVNSGSSANLIAFSTLTSSTLGEKAIQPGDEVITVAAGFPTTVNPIIQNNCVPVFIDVDIPTYNVDPSLIEQAITPKTKAIMLAHTLGNPFNLDVVTKIAKEHNLYLVEDTCDALGAKYNDQVVGTFGDMGTLSFYPAHHITMGEGGAVFTNSNRLKRAAESLRDWGRDCWCAPGQDNTCNKRFDWRLGQLPEGYDHKYIYSHVGYNLKITDMQAAVGVSQLKKLDRFIQQRNSNFSKLMNGLGHLEEYLILPKATANSTPSWFGFPITLRDGQPLRRRDLLRHLDEKKIGTRLLFGGNLTKQPYLQEKTYRVASELNNTDKIMNDTFWIGLYPGLTSEMLDYVCESINQYCKDNA